MEDHRIAHPEKLKIRDPWRDREYIGGNQLWYTGVIKRLAGCGPTSAANIFHYLEDRFPAGAIPPAETKSDFRRLMDELWKHVTPTHHGVYCTGIFYNGCDNYAREKGAEVECRWLDVPPPNEPTPQARPILPKDPGPLPSLDEVLAFVRDALDEDLPVAFLSLESGTEASIDRWHWITIIALYQKEEPGAQTGAPEAIDPMPGAGQNDESGAPDPDMYIDFLDAGIVRTANLSSWYRTSRDGGGFVAVRPVESRPIDAQR